MTDAEKRAREVVKSSRSITLSATNECFESIKTFVGRLHINITKALIQAHNEGREEGWNKAIEKINLFWRFDNNQQPLSSWHDKQDCLESIRQSNQEESKCRFG